MNFRTWSVGVVGLFLLLGLGGCQSKHESAYSSMISLLDQVADRLGQIKSNADLVDAKPDLQKLGAKMKDQSQAMEKLGEPTADERKALEKKYKPKLEEAFKHVQTQLERLGREVGDSAPLEVLAELGTGPMGLMGMDMQ